jgi:hypothetical protein
MPRRFSEAADLTIRLNTLGHSFLFFPPHIFPLLTERSRCILVSVTEETPVGKK